MSDNENDGGVPIREEQKPIGRPQGTLIKFDKVHEHCLTDGIETKEKIDFIDSTSNQCYLESHFVYLGSKADEHM
jgi:hypothetical protein